MREENGESIVVFVGEMGGEETPSLFLEGEGILLATFDEGGANMAIILETEPAGAEISALAVSTSS